MESLVKIPKNLSLSGATKSPITSELLKASLLAELKKLPNPNNKFKLCISLTSMVCIMIENIIKDNKVDKIDKKDVVVFVISSYCTLTEAEKVILGDQIEFLLNSNLVNKTKKWIVTRVYRKIKKLGKKKE